MYCSAEVHSSTHLPETIKSLFPPKNATPLLFVRWCTCPLYVPHDDPPPTITGRPRAEAAVEDSPPCALYGVPAPPPPPAAPVRGSAMCAGLPRSNGEAKGRMRPPPTRDA